MREDNPAVGTVLAGQYRLTEVVGEGGMGVIYRARQENIGRDVAIKVLRARYAKDESVVSRFENEAKIISQLRHPNTLRLYDTQQTNDGLLFIVTEYLQGQSLESLLKSGPLPLDRVLHIADQIAASLTEAHAMGVVHRDLKPGNIFLDRVGGEDHVKVLDFGIAKLAQGAVVKTQANIILGTPGYMSPEQVRGIGADARSDIYALGVLIYQMLAGRPPFVSENPVTLLMMQVDDPPPPLDRAIGAPLELEALVFEMLSKDPANRPQEVGEVRDRLRAIGRTLSAAGPIELVARKPSPRPERIPSNTRKARGVSVSTMPVDAPDQLPTQAWARPLAERRSDLGADLGRAEPTIEPSLGPPETITVPIEYDPPIELGSPVELFLDDPRPESITRGDRATRSPLGVIFWTLLLSGLAAAALIMFNTRDLGDAPTEPIVEPERTETAENPPQPVAPAPKKIEEAVNEKRADVEPSKSAARVERAKPAARVDDGELDSAAAKILPTDDVETTSAAE